MDILNISASAPSELSSSESTNEEKIKTLVAEFLEMQDIKMAEKHEWQVSLATQNIAIGKKLLEIEKLVRHYEFEITDMLVGDDGKQKISPAELMLCKGIASVSDCDDYSCLGWDNLTIISGLNDHSNSISFKDILEDVEIPESTPKESVIKLIPLCKGIYETYKIARGINSKVSFKVVVTFRDKISKIPVQELKKLLKKKPRPDLVLANYQPVTVKSPGTVNKGKRTEYENGEFNLVKGKETLRQAAEYGSLPDNIDDLLFDEFCFYVVHADSDRKDKILPILLERNNEADNIAKRYVEEILK